MTFQDLVVVYTTFPDKDLAREVGRAAVEAHLAACVNILPMAISIYAWEGEVHDADETVAIFKTWAAQVDALMAEIIRLHPYDVPGMVALPVIAAPENYADWIRFETGAAFPPPPPVEEPPED